MTGRPRNQTNPNPTTHIMSTPVTPVVTSTVQQATGQLEAAAAQAVIAGVIANGAIELPNGASAANVQNFSISLTPQGGAKFNVSIKS